MLTLTNRLVGRLTSVPSLTWPAYRPNISLLKNRSVIIYVTFVDKLRDATPEGIYAQFVFSL